MCKTGFLKGSQRKGLGLMRGLKREKGKTTGWVQRKAALTRTGLLRLKARWMARLLVRWKGSLMATNCLASKTLLADYFWTERMMDPEMVE